MSTVVPEILANGVKCKPGATVGQLDENARFDLGSRGIGLADARRLLGEVAALAERFGWSEEALLAMPGSRRRAYLDLVRAT